MARTDMVILPEDWERFSASLEGLRTDSNARYVLLLDRSGQQVASAGAIEGLDPTSLASLAAGNVAATEGLAQLAGEPGFSSLSHEGRTEGMHLSLISESLILLVLFNQDSSVGLVRLRVDQRSSELARTVELMEARAAATSASAAGPAFEITDEDIDALFG